MTSMNLVLRPSSKGCDQPGSLSLRLIHNRQPKTITLKGCRIYVKEWDSALQTIIYPENDKKRASYLEEVEKKIDRELELLNSFLLQLQKKGQYTIEELISLYREKKDDGKLSGYAEKLAKELERNGQYRTAGAYRTVVRGLIKYNKGEDIPLRHINACLIRGFEKHLKELGRMPNTVAYYIRDLRAIYNKAVSAKRIIQRRGENPFAGISTAVTKTMKRALSNEELQAFYRIEFDRFAKGLNDDSRYFKYLQNLQKSWRYFYFCFFARGMCFIDLAYLRKENVRGGYIRYCRKKTGQQLEIRITDELQTIMDSFSDETLGSAYVFPIISDTGRKARLQYESALRTQNSRLKKLASLAGIKSAISTHVARHSWASVGKQSNVPIHVISECLGHDSPMTTMIYTAMLNNRILDDANEIVSKAIRLPGLPSQAFSVAAGY